MSTNSIWKHDYDLVNSQLNISIFMFHSVKQITLWILVFSSLLVPSYQMWGGDGGWSVLFSIVFWLSGIVLSLQFFAVSPVTRHIHITQGNVSPISLFYFNATIRCWYLRSGVWFAVASSLQNRYYRRWQDTWLSSWLIQTITEIKLILCI